jgi:hypothetical protein
MRLVIAARRDIEQLLGVDLSNTKHYAVLGRLDALGADAALLIDNALEAARK